jgi:capsule biosynthesis phosphatase
LYDYKKCLVIDVDNTICTAADPAKPYDYINAIPIWLAIHQIRQFHKRGIFIIFNTARYFRECHGDIKQIYEHGYDELKRWLDYYEVPYNLIVLGKPSATYYLDDKAFHIKDETSWEELDAII